MPVCSVVSRSIRRTVWTTRSVTEISQGVVMPNLSNTPSTRTTADPNNGALRGWFDDSMPVQASKSFMPRALARTTLTDNARLFNWNASLPDLVDGQTLQGQGNVSVRFVQHFKGVPVDT